MDSSSFKMNTILESRNSGYYDNKSEENKINS